MKGICECKVFITWIVLTLNVWTWNVWTFEHLGQISELDLCSFERLRCFDICIVFVTSTRSGVVVWKQFDHQTSSSNLIWSNLQRFYPSIHSTQPSWPMGHERPIGGACFQIYLVNENEP